MGVGNFSDSFLTFMTMDIFLQCALTDFQLQSFKEVGKIFIINKAHALQKCVFLNY
jgi:hypothetical protein